MAQQLSSDAPEVVPATQHIPQESKWSNFETVFTNAKAGMSGVNKDHVKRIVYEMSKVRRYNGYTPLPSTRPCSAGLQQGAPYDLPGTAVSGHEIH